MGDISHSTSISTRAIEISEQKQSGHISAKAIGISWQMTLCNLQSNLHSRFITPSSNAPSLHTDNGDEQDHFPVALLHKTWAIVLLIWPLIPWEEKYSSKMSHSIRHVKRNSNHIHTYRIPLSFIAPAILLVVWEVYRKNRVYRQLSLLSRNRSNKYLPTYCIGQYRTQLVSFNDETLSDDVEEEAIE